MVVIHGCDAIRGVSEVSFVSVLVCRSPIVPVSPCNNFFVLN